MNPVPSPPSITPDRWLDTAWSTILVPASSAARVAARTGNKAMMKIHGARVPLLGNVWRGGVMGKGGFRDFWGFRLPCTKRSDAPRSRPADFARPAGEVRALGRA